MIFFKFFLILFLTLKTLQIKNKYQHNPKYITKFVCRKCIKLKKKSNFNFCSTTKKRLLKNEV